MGYVVGSKSTWFHSCLSLRDVAGLRLSQQIQDGPSQTKTYPKHSIRLVHLATRLGSVGGKPGSSRYVKFLPFGRFFG